MAEYEDTLLDLITLKDLGENKIYVHGYFELVISQVKYTYQTKHPRMRAYRNLVLDFFENVSEYNILVVPREHNLIAYDIYTFGSIFKIPIYPNNKYEIEVKNRPTILNNVKYWKVFENDKQIIRFLQMEEEHVVGDTSHTPRIYFS
jgi:hypothetical protein